MDQEVVVVVLYLVSKKAVILVVYPNCTLQVRNDFRELFTDKPGRTLPTSSCMVL